MHYFKIQGGDGDAQSWYLRIKPEGTACEIFSKVEISESMAMNE